MKDKETKKHKKKKSLESKSNVKTPKKVKSRTSKYSKLKIKDRLTKAFLQITVTLSVAAVISVIALFLMSASYENVLTNYGFSQGDIGKAMTALSDTRSAIRGAIGYEKQSDLDTLVKQYGEKKEAFNTHLQDIAAIMTSDEEQAQYAAIVEAADKYWTLGDEILVEGIYGEDKSAVEERAVSELDPLYSSVYDALLKILNDSVDKGDWIYNTMFILKFALTALIVAIVVVAVVSAMKIGKEISGGIVEPLSKLGQRINTFAHGDLASPFPHNDADDEITVIIRDCENMASNLNDIISDVGQLLGQMAEGNFAVDSSIDEKYEGDFAQLLASIRELNGQLGVTLRQIYQAAEQVNQGASQLADSAEDLAEGASDQASAVQELMATIESVSNISENSAEVAAQSAKQAKEAVETADKSRIDMQDLIVAMSDITKTSKEIENIIAAIEDIASQTNLLSLNASIEAARAGEAGRGFAVVADQIGKLANDSAASAVSTKELISKSLSQIDRGNVIVENTMATIGEVLENMSRLATSADESSATSRAQADMLGQVEVGIEQISTVVQNNSAASEETSAISEELSAQAISLQEMVGAFTLQ